MVMTTAEQILVILLSGLLAVFLVCGIVIAIKTIQILNQIKRLTHKAEEIADKAEAVGEFFKASAGPAAIGKLIANVVAAARKHNDK